MVSLLGFWNENVPIALLSSYACHPQSYYRLGIPSPDFPGIARFIRGQDVNSAMHVHFNGAGGNIAAGKYNDGSQPNRMNLATRLAMIRTALTLGVSEEAGSAFWKMFEQKIRKRAKSRNIVVHAIWTVHADYPNELIRTSGIMDPFLNAERYSLADFLGIELELAKLREGLRVFDMLLPSQFPHRDQTERPPFWRRSEPQQPEADAQGQSDQTHPSE